MMPAITEAEPDSVVTGRSAGGDCAERRPCVELEGDGEGEGLVSQESREGR